MINDSLLDGNNNYKTDINVLASIYVAPVALFFFLVLGWQFICVPIFRRYDIDYLAVLNVRTELQSSIGSSKVDSVTAPRAWIQSTVAALACTVVIFFIAHVHWGSITVQTAVAMSYGTAITCVLAFFYARGPVYPLRCLFRQSIYRCFVPYHNRETPFIEVLLADTFCSLAKPLYQVSMGIVMLAAARGIDDPDWNSLQAASRTRSVLPYVFWALPFVLRARQTILSSVSSTGQKRVIHFANFIKYSLNFFVIFCAFQWASSMNAGITEKKVATQSVEENREPVLFAQDRESETIAFETMWIIFSVLNEIYTVMWDICMDWGLGGVSLRQCGLRNTLVFPRKWYYVAIVIDLVGRSLWSARFSPLVMNNMGGVKLVVACECYEVARRLMWNIFRMEWELIKTTNLKSEKSGRDINYYETTELTTATTTYPPCVHANNNAVRFCTASLPTATFTRATAEEHIFWWRKKRNSDEKKNSGLELQNLTPSGAREQQQHKDQFLRKVSHATKGQTGIVNDNTVSEANKTTNECCSGECGPTQRGDSITGERELDGEVL